MKDLKGFCQSGRATAMSSKLTILFFDDKGDSLDDRRYRQLVAEKTLIAPTVDCPCRLEKLHIYVNLSRDVIKRGGIQCRKRSIAIESGAL
jgi:hypothetical protein